MPKLLSQLKGKSIFTLKQPDSHHLNPVIKFRNTNSRMFSNSMQYAMRSAIYEIHMPQMFNPNWMKSLDLTFQFINASENQGEHTIRKS